MLLQLPTIPFGSSQLPLLSSVYGDDVVGGTVGGTGVGGGGGGSVAIVASVGITWRGVVKRGGGLSKGF